MILPRFKVSTDSHARMEIVIEIESVYNMYRVKPVVVFGPSQICHEKAYKSWPNREPPKSNLSKGSWGFLLSPGECVVHSGC
jgi:hypothetical protein